ncbi:MAG: T9SS type A sorting domain-containing protein [Bacteroidales bacterium]|nr:T9SS type A sorting domain-containing protein [Bacteroidales bacterium]
MGYKTTPSSPVQIKDKATGGLTLQEIANDLGLDADEISTYVRWGLAEADGTQTPLHTPAWQNELHVGPFSTSEWNEYPFGIGTQWNSSFYADGYGRWYTGKYDSTPDGWTSDTPFQPYFFFTEFPGLDAYLTLDFSPTLSNINNYKSDDEGDSFFQIQYRFYFGEKEDDFTNIDNAIEHTKSLSLSSTTQSSWPADDFNNYFSLPTSVNYVRLSILQNGELVDPTTVCTFSPAGSYTSFVDISNGDILHGWYSLPGGYLSSIPFSITAINGAQLSNLQIAAYTSSQAPTFESDESLSQEPEIEDAFIISFMPPFKGEFTGEASIIQTAIPNAFIAEEKTFALSYSNNSLQGKLTYDTGLGWDASQSFDYTSQINLNEITPKYIRWYVRDKNTLEECPELIATAQYTDHFKTAVNGNYLFWCYELDNYYQRSWKDLVKIVFGLTLIPDGLDITDYELVADISTDNISSSYIDTTNNTLIHEPDVLSHRIIFQFNSREYPSVEAIEKTVEIEIESEKNPEKIITNFFNNYSTQVLDFFGGTSPTYLRYYLEKKDANGDFQPVESYSDYVQYPDGTALDPESLGYYKTSFSDANSTNQPFLLPEDESIDDYRVVYLLSDQSDGITGYVEPTIRLRYIFTFWDGNDSFVNVSSYPTVTYYKEYLIDDKATLTATLDLLGANPTWDDIPLPDEAITYARVTVKKADGTHIVKPEEYCAIQGIDNWIQANDHRNGWYCAYPDGLEDLPLTITAIDGHLLTDLQLVIYFSTEQYNVSRAQSITLNANGTFDREPLVNYVYTITFDTPFADTIGTPEVLTITTQMGASYYRSTQYYYYYSDNTFSQTYYDQGSEHALPESTLTGTVPDFSNATTLYARFYFRKKGGLEDKSMSQYFYKLSTDPMLNITSAADSRYRYWSSHYGGFIPTLEQLIKFGVNGDYVSLREYELVIDISTNAIPAEYFNSENKLIHEPILTHRIVFTYTSTKFVHYEGYANAAGDYEVINAETNQLRQMTHEWTYHIYVRNGHSKTLWLPFESTWNPGKDLEPQAYIRWYDYNTDFQCEYIQPYGSASTNLLTEPYFEDNGRSRGYFGLNLPKDDGPTATEAAAVTFTAPADQGDDWEIVVACDVSKYIDGMDNDETEWLHEPTLSIRYIYIIHSAKYGAEEIKDAVIQGQGKVLYENHGAFFIGIKDDDTKASLRADNPDITNYYYYQYLPPTSEGDVVSEDNFDYSHIYEAKSMRWYVYDSTGKYKADATSLIDTSADLFSGPNGRRKNNGEFLYFSTGDLMDLVFYERDHFGQADQKKANVKFGENAYAYFYGFASDQELSETNPGHICPIVSYTVRFLANSYPKPFDQLESWRSLDYLESPENFSRVARIHFDEENDMGIPTNPTENFNPLPLNWKRGSYGYCYPSLINRSYGQAKKNGVDGGFMGISPLHGDYTLLKSMNVPDVSTGTVGDYSFQWWYTDSEVYDRTHEITGGEYSGYYLYLDASDESRQIAEVEFTGHMCVGSCMIISAAVTDLTTGIKPQLVFNLYGYDIDENGNETKQQIHAFSTGDYFTNGVSSSGTWDQVYGKIYFREGSGIEDYTHFLISIDNFCHGTQGADYAIDDIRIYISNGKALIEQQNSACGNEDTPLKISMEQKTLTAFLEDELMSTLYEGEVPMYWRICSEDNTIVYPPEGTEINGQRCIKTIIPKYFTQTSDLVIPTDCRVVYDDASTPDVDEFTAGFEWGTDGYLYFVIACQDFDLPQEDADGNVIHYYISIAELDTDDDNINDAIWGSPSDTCSLYSDLFWPHKQKVQLYDGESAIDEITFTCDDNGQKTVTIHGKVQMPDQYGNYETYDDSSIIYHWILWEKAATEGELDTKLYETPEGKYEHQFTWTFELGKTYLIMAQTNPAITSVTINGKIYQVCSDMMEVTLGTDLGGPKMTLGFSEIPSTIYPSDRNLRLGLCQIVANQQGKSIWVPVYSMEYKATATDDSAIMPLGDATLISTNDPTATQYIGKIIASVTGSKQKTYTVNGIDHQVGIVNANSMYVLLDLVNEDSGDMVALPFHEGYEYKIEFNTIDIDDISDLYPAEGETLTPCIGTTQLTLKVVPEYLTWTNAKYHNTNWLNDENWRRSYVTELYKTEDNLGHNSDNYHDYPLTQDDGLTHMPAYVPMKFSKVTIPADVQAPMLSSMATNAYGIIETPNNHDNSSETTGIIYDMMVRMIEDEENPTGGLGCEKFYGNTCDQIYFKPQAELRYQHYLTYNQAWVEKEFTPNKWSIFSTPLKDIVAGDMYVPKTGRQTTEAFQPILFNTTTYSRNAYPFYQRSWDNLNCQVILPIDDEQGDSYDAFISTYDWANAEATKAVQANWSHTFNNVAEPYTELSGISIRANNSDDAETALLRLPKADTEYTYYFYDDETDGKTNETQVAEPSAISREGYGRLVSDDRNVYSNAITSAPDTNVSPDNPYILTGNPFMSTVDLEQFFTNRLNYNVALEDKYWYVADGQIQYAMSIYDESTDTYSWDYTGDSNNGWLSPMQAFFVKLREGETLDQITFLPDWQVDYQSRNPSTASLDPSSSTLTITARNGAGKGSSAKVRVQEGASMGFLDREDMEALFDSNLMAEAPMVYTLAGDMAAVINTVPELSCIPFGVSANEDEPVEVTFSGADGLYVYDASKGRTTPITDPITILSNKHGRYFISDTAIGEEAIEELGAQIFIYASGPGLVAISAPGCDRIDEVYVYTINGQLVDSLKNIKGDYASLALPSGLYIITAQAGTASKSAKIIVNHCR